MKNRGVKGKVTELRDAHDGRNGNQEPEDQHQHRRSEGGCRLS